jgi:hypothetical protein
VDRIKDSCPPFGSPDEQFKVMVLGSLNPLAGGCASMRADIGNYAPAFEILLGDIDYSVRGHQKSGMYNELLYCYSTIVRGGFYAASVTPESSP